MPDAIISRDLNFENLFHFVPYIILQFHFFYLKQKKNVLQNMTWKTAFFAVQHFLLLHWTTLNTSEQTSAIKIESNLL